MRSPSSSISRRSGGQAAGGETTSSPRLSMWSRLSGEVCAGEAEAILEPVEDGRLARAEVEVAAEDQRRLAGPAVGVLGGSRDLELGECAAARAGARVEIRDADGARRRRARSA